MARQSIYDKIQKRDFNLQEVAVEASQHPNIISELIEGLGSEKANIRYGCDKILRFIGKENPSILYPYFDLFVANLNSEKTIFKWGAIDILANLESVDCDNRIEKIFNIYFSPLTGPVMITAANIVKGAAQIALAKPELADRIAIQLLKVEKGKYQTDECRHIVIGQAIKSFALFFNQVKRKKPVIEFVTRQLKSSRLSTQKSAVKFLKNIK